MNEPLDVDVSGGSRPRIVVRNKQNYHQYFFKTYLHNSREIWAEMFASKLGNEIEGYSVQQVSIKEAPPELEQRFRKEYKDYLPEDWKPIGAQVDNAFPKGYQVRYAYLVFGLEETESISFQNVYDTLKRGKYCYSSPDDLLQSFSNMVVFDAIIGNMDRHLENWGILEDDSLLSGQMVVDPKTMLQGSAKFTPLFDNGSSCLYELEEKRVEEYLKDFKRFQETYLFGRPYSLLKNSIGEERNVFDLIKEIFIQASQKHWRPFFKKSIEKILQIDTLNIARILFKMPKHKFVDYSETRQELLFRSIGAKISKLESLLQKPSP